MDEFVVGLRPHNQFNNWVALNFTLEGSGAAVIFYALWFNCNPCLVVGLVLAVIGATALFLDLGSPLHSWRSVINSKGSWISRGALFLLCLFFFTFAYLVFPGLRNSDFKIVFLAGGEIFSILVMLYTGFLLCGLKAIPFWNSKLLPPLFLVQSLASGFLVMHCVLALLQPEQPVGAVFLFLEFSLLTIAAATVWLHLRNSAVGSFAARESIKRLLSGDLKIPFWAGGIVLGLFVPLACVLIGQTSARWLPNFIWLSAGAMARICGDFFLRASFLKSAVFESILE